MPKEPKEPKSIIPEEKLTIEQKRFIFFYTKYYDAPLIRRKKVQEDMNISPRQYDRYRTKLSGNIDVAMKEKLKVETSVKDMTTPNNTPTMTGSILSRSGLANEVIELYNSQDADGKIKMLPMLIKLQDDQKDELLEQVDKVAQMTDDELILYNLSALQKVTQRTKPIKLVKAVLDGLQTGKYKEVANGGN